MGMLRKNLTIAAGSALLGTAAVLALPVTAQAAPAAPCSAKADACIDLSTNRSWLTHNGAVTYGGVPITSGKPGY